MKLKEDGGLAQCVFMLAALTDHRIMVGGDLGRLVGIGIYVKLELSMIIGNLWALGAGRLLLCKDLLGK